MCRSTISFKRSLTLAKDTLSQIAKTHHRNWSEILNKEAANILEGLSASYKDIAFLPDLSFSLKVRGVDRPLASSEIQQVLSSGARDQIYFAVRLAISQGLSHTSERLPLLMDDPFATFDDERFEEAMLFLCEHLSREHQIILLSCHEERHDWFRKRHRKLFDKKIHLQKLDELYTGTNGE